MTFPEYDSVYAERNFVLRSMGFETYAAYLDSDIWKKIRLRVLRRDKKRSGREVQSLDKKPLKSKSLPLGKESSRESDDSPATKRQCKCIIKTCVKWKIVLDPTRLTGLTFGGWKKWMDELRQLYSEARRQSIPQRRELKRLDDLARREFNREISKQIEERARASLPEGQPYPF